VANDEQLNKYSEFRKNVCVKEFSYAAKIQWINTGQNDESIWINIAGRAMSP